MNGLDYKRIIIVGKGGSGKDYLRKMLENLGFKYCVSHTTRPPREGEVDGVDYHFIKNRIDLIKYKNFFYEYVIFNGWLYGTSKEEFYKSDLFIMTPSGISKIKPEDRKESFIIFLDIAENVLRERLSKRNDADNSERRIKSDQSDFKNFSDFDCIINNQNFTIDEVIEKIGLKND
jgi:guanylate kinase